jgi:hypothetical protein
MLRKKRLSRRILALAGTLEGVSVRQTGFSLTGDALVLEEALAKGKPEAFVREREFAIVREEGSVHLTLDPGWGQKVLQKDGRESIHSLAIWPVLSHLRASFSTRLAMRKN